METITKDMEWINHIINQEWDSTKTKAILWWLS